MGNRGRPTKYRSEYCKMLIDHMTSGLSYQSFAAVVNVNIDTLYEWEKNNKDFSDAKRVGFTNNLHFWEKLGVLGAAGKVKGFNVTSWIFNMKNRHGWRDRVSLDVDAKVDVTLSPEERKRKIAEYERKREKKV